MPPDPRDTCWTMLRAAADGDATSRSFSQTYEATIRDFLDARWRGRILSTEVDDATREVLIECLKPDGVLARADDDRGDFRGLLFGVARNVARRFEERAQQRGRLRPEDSGFRSALLPRPALNSVDSPRSRHSMRGSAALNYVLP